MVVAFALLCYWVFVLQIWAIYNLQQNFNNPFLVKLRHAGMKVSSFK